MNLLGESSKKRPFRYETHESECSWEECRREAEALDMLLLVNTGHRGKPMRTASCQYEVAKRKH